MKYTNRKLPGNIILFSAIIITGFVLACKTNKPLMDWIPQYPDGYKPIYSRAELVYSDSDWKDAQGPVDFSINDIYANDSNEVWAIKDDLQILYSMDGLKFKKIATPKVHQLNCIKGAGKDVWAVGCQGSIIHIKNGKCVKEGFGLTKNDIWALWLNPDGTECWAVGNGGLIMHFKAGKWTVVQPDITKLFIHDVWMKPDGSEGWAVGNEGIVLHYTGGKWTITAADSEKRLFSKPNDLMKVWMNQAGTEGWAIGEDGTILHYKSGEWAREGSPCSYCNMHNLWMQEDCSEGWAWGSTSSIRHYINGTWYNVEETSGYAYGNSMYADGGTCWMLGNKVVYHTTAAHTLATLPLYYDFATQCISGNKNGIWIGCSDDNIIKIGTSPNVVYPTLTNCRYHLFPENNPDSIAFDFQVAAKDGNLNQYLPIVFSLKVKQKDAANSQYVQSPFIRTVALQNPGIWTAKFSLKQFDIDMTRQINTQLKMTLTFRTENATEDVVYDIREGSNDYLTLKN